MKFRSIIWTYLMLSILYLTNMNVKSSIKVPGSLTTQDLKSLAIDSVYSHLSFEEKINLLSINTLKSDFQDSLTLLPNGFLVFLDTLNENSNFINVNENLEFQKTPFKMAFWEDRQNVVGNLTIGQTDEAKFSKYKENFIAESLKNKGINILLGNFFQTYNNKLKNERVAFTQSPLSSEKFWQAKLEGAQESGLKLGVSDPFMLDVSIDSTEEKEFQAIGLAGNRYYARRGHGIIQLNNNFLDFHNRIRPKSSKNKQTYLRENFQFSGLIVSPDLSVLPAKNQAQMALENIRAGSDIVCISFEVKQALDSLLKLHFAEKEKELKESCYRVLNLKYDLFKIKDNQTAVKKYEKQFEYQVKQSAISSILNSNKILPINDLNQSIYFHTLRENQAFIQSQLHHYCSAKSIETEGKNSKGICIVDGFNDNLSQTLKWANQYSGELQLVLITDQTNIEKHRVKKLDAFDAILVAGDSSKLSQEITIQSLFGAYSVSGKIPFYLSPKFPLSAGLELQSLSRLAYVAPEYVGISAEKLFEIDKIVEEGIAAEAYPGCQVLVGVEGKVIYEKAFGFQDFSQNSKVDQRTIYDIASITKIAASTASLMKLQSDGLFSLDKTLGDYIPEIVGNTEFASINLRDMMAHQAGLPAWIPFYLKTLSGGKPSPFYYSKTRTDDYNVPVAKDLWIKNYYPDTIYERILSSKLKSKSYVYSDLGYYFVKKIIEKLAHEKMEAYVFDSIYKQLGLQSMTYNPYLKFDLDRIAPTENDKEFRKQVIKGYVHDPGAAMLGGVGGHAGIFSTANDLAILMQMMLNNGYYGGKQLLKKEVLDEYTAVQFPTFNRRGAGFDKPNLNGSQATACSMASPESYGHSGFTGTLTWADPKNKINYVFLSNRVYPSAENWKITKMDIRTRIQTKIYQAVESADKLNFLQ